MRIVLTHFGTTGDIQPFLALAVELQRHGHQVVLAVSPHFATWVRAYRVEVEPVGPDLKQQINAVSLAASERPDLHGSRDGVFELARALLDALPQAYADLERVCRGADLLISGPQQPAARMLHERTGIPFVSVQLTYFGNLGTQEYRQATAELFNPFRRQLGLPPLADPLTRGADSPRLALYAMSRHLLSLPADRAEHQHLTGFFYLDEPDFEPDAALDAFLAAGEAPVVLTFGSNFHQSPQQLVSLLTEAVERAGCRAIIQRGWSGLELDDLPAGVHLVDYVPHSWLFRRASMVVHHGGIGTAAAVWRAGVPAVFVPHVFDQFLWARLAEDLGVAGPTVAFEELDAASLARSIAATREAPEIRRRASELGQQVRAENGVRQARILIESMARSEGLIARTEAPERTEEAGPRRGRRKTYQCKKRRSRDRAADPISSR